MSGHRQRDKQVSRATAAKYGERGGGTRRRTAEGRGKERESETDVDDVGRRRTQRAFLQNQRSSTDTEQKAHRAPHHLPLSLPEDPDLFSYILPSHSDSIFACLYRLKEEKLLLDCNFTLQGISFQAHRLVMAAASQTPDALFGLCKEDTENRLTPLGFRVVLDFAYSGDVTVDLSKEELMEEVLSACACLDMERLRQRCMSKVKTSAAAEREKSLETMKNMWDRGTGCDVTIQAESGERFPAHRVVLAAGGDYFRALFCGGLRESTEDVVCLRGVTSRVIESILSFTYTGQLRLSWSRIWELTDALFQFQLQGALSLCISFLRDRMDVNTCLDVLVLAETYGLVQLAQAAEEHVLTHFQCVSAGEKFKDVPFSLLDKLLEKDSLRVESEMVVFRAVLSWVEDNPENRLSVLPDLLHRVRLPLLSSTELQEALSCSLLRQNPRVRGSLEALRSLLKGDYKGPECPPRTTNQVLVLVGGDTVDEDFMKRVPSQTLWLARQFHRGPGLIRRIDWKPFTELPQPARFRHCVCLLSNKLYVLGGRKYYGALDILKSAWRFDASQRKWERLPDMLCQRDFFSAVGLDGKVFALGGNCDDSQYLDAVEYYSPEQNTWRRSHPLATAVCGHAAAVLDGQIYISGGCDPQQRCLPSMWHYHPSHGCSSRAPMTAGAGRAGHIMLALGRVLVVAGGLQPSWVGFGDQLLCELYDPTLDAWSSIRALPRPHLSPGATVLDGRLYVVGGSSADTARDTKWVHRYDPMEGCWENLGAMPHPYTDLAACSLQLSDLVDEH